jgi:rSAM/selenodomain-associated transferase 1
MASSILLFIKAPVKGRVKSRLALELDEDAALGLYRSFILDMLDTINKTGHSCTIFFYPPDSGEAVTAWLGPGRTCLPQEGEDLGLRMANAFATIFNKGASRAILIGSDLPDLPVDLLTGAIKSLDDHDAVLGPAKDGGYYLIGFRRETFLPDIFHGIEWSTNQVFAETISRFERLGKRIFLAPVWRDVDTLADLKDLEARNADTPFAKSRTMKFIKTC